MKEFWQHLNAEYTFSGEHLRILQVTAEAWDRCQAARLAIACDGMVVNEKRHPLLGIESKSMELFLRGLRDLGLEAEANHATPK